MLYSFPKKALVDQQIPKIAIYNANHISSRIKEFFISQVDRIVLSYTLHPQFINIPATLDVPEIDIFTINLRQENLDLDVLKSIDAAIPRPAIFELKFEGKIRITACYKRPNEADHSKWVRSGYFSSDWLDADSDRVPLPMSLDLGSLYGHLLEALIPVDARQGESLSALAARVERIHAKQREMDKLAGQLAKEKQFNHKVEINAYLRKLKKELEGLKA